MFFFVDRLTSLNFSHLNKFGKKSCERALAKYRTSVGTRHFGYNANSLSLSKVKSRSNVKYSENLMFNRNKI